MDDPQAVNLYSRGLGEISYRALEALIELYMVAPVDYDMDHRGASEFLGCLIMVYGPPAVCYRHPTFRPHSVYLPI